VPFHLKMSDFRRSPCSSAPSVSAVVLNYQGGKIIHSCLTSLCESEYTLREIVVADNGSRDASLEVVRRDFPNVVVVENGANLGAPEGRNRGLRRALEKRPDYIYTLDNDLRIHPRSILELVQLCECDSRVGCAGSIIYHEGEKDLIFNAGNWINWTQNLVRSRAMNVRDRGQIEEICHVDYVGSGAMLVPRRVYETVGLFDPGFIGYGYEDSDFGLRVKAAGFSVVCCSRSKVWHRPFSGIGRYSFKKKYLESRNAVRFLRIHGNAWAWLKFSFFVVGGLGYATIREGLRGNIMGVVGKARGLWDGVLGREDFAWKLLDSDKEP